MPSPNRRKAGLHLCEQGARRARRHGTPCPVHDSGEGGAGFAKNFDRPTCNHSGCRLKHIRLDAWFATIAGAEPLDQAPPSQGARQPSDFNEGGRTAGHGRFSNQYILEYFSRLIFDYARSSRLSSLFVRADGASPMDREAPIDGASRLHGVPWISDRSGLRMPRPKLRGNRLRSACVHWFWCNDLPSQSPPLFQTIHVSRPFRAGLRACRCDD